MQLVSTCVDLRRLASTLSSALQCRVGEGSAEPRLAVSTVSMVQAALCRQR